MSLTLTFGEPDWETGRIGAGENPNRYLWPVVETFGAEAVHSDDYESESGPPSRRSISGRTWGQMRDAMPAFDRLMTDLELHALKHSAHLIPAVHYEHRLDEVGQEAIDALDGEHEPEAQRVLWFVRWSQYSIDACGDRGAFKVPLEWNV